MKKIKYIKYTLLIKVIYKILEHFLILFINIIITVQKTHYRI